MHLHVMDDTTTTRYQLIIFQKEKNNISFEPGDIILLINAYINDKKQILNCKKETIQKILNLWSNKTVNEIVSSMKRHFHLNMDIFYPSTWETNVEKMHI